MKKTAKKLLSMALVLVMVLSMLPAVTLPAQAADDDTVDAFGITLSEWTAAEKAEAEANLPFGAGYNTWSTLLEKNELFFSMGYDGATRLTGLFDWNGTEGTTTEEIRKKIDNFGQGQLTSRTENYKAVATAAMDLYGTGKKEYVANLALNASGNTLYLYVTDSSNNQVGVVRRVFEDVAQLGGMQIHQINGAFSIAAGDFDGDGKDTIVVYVPQTDANKETQKGISPFIKEFSFEQDAWGYWNFNAKSTVAANVLTLLGNTGINVIDKMHNQPMVDLVAEDVDKDGFDELIVTAGMNDVTNNDRQLQSQVFVYDRLNGQTAGITPTADGKWNLSYQAMGKCNSEGTLAPGIYIKDDKYKRVVWASSTVGNVITSVGSGVDYPEIVTAGFIDDEQSNTQHINVGGDDKIGVSVVQVMSVADSTSNKFTYSANGKSMSAVNVICEYGEAFNQALDSNSWTRGGFYESEDVNGLLQVQAYADRGIGSAEAVFISGTVYRANSEGEKLERKYTHDGFTGKDDFAPGGRVLTNTTVAAVTAGNFDGNDEGREQLVCVTAMKQSGKNNAYSQVYFYHNEATCDDKGTWTDAYNSKRSGYLTEHKGNFYVSLAPLDTDDDSILVKLEEITRDYSKPDVLAILETSPYFAEIEDSFNNSETTYGIEDSKIEGSSNTFGFTVGSSVGYEFESSIAQSGGGFEVAIERAYNWTTAKSNSEAWGMEFRNDTGDNAVVVYRCPVVTYRYVDQDGKKLLVEQVGRPATNMISVDDYNEAAAQYDDLDLIDDNIVKLGESGNPASYRSSTKGLTNALQYNGVGAIDGSNGDSSGGWAQYQGSGSMMQYWTGGKETEKTFSYDLGVSLNIFAKIGGVTASATFGFAYAREQTHINGRSVTKSGAVSCVNVPGYDFRWKLAAWNCELNGGTVPVIGYLVKDVVAPPSPAEGLTAESITTDSITLRWSSGIREADQYRIYRIRETAPQYVLVGAVQGDETSFTLTGLKPGETYTYVVRGVSYVNNSESVDSAPITVRTQSEGSTVQLKLVGASLTSDNTLQSTGAEASLYAHLSGISGGSASFQWQLLENDAEGIKNGWRSVNELSGTAIGSVSGATSSTLTLRTIDRSLSGAYLRCVVTTTSSAGDIETYYSPIVTLDLNGLTTTTTVAVAGQTGVSGSITDPYTGLANYTAITEKTEYGSVRVPATVEKDGKTYAIYQDATDEDAPVYVAVLDGGDAGSRTYYAASEDATGESVSYTPGDLLTLEDDSYYYSSGDTDVAYPVPTTGFNGVDTVSEPGDDGTIYVKQYAVTDAGLTAYWRSATGGLYYTRSVVEGTVSYTPADPQPGSGADLRMVYYENESDSLLILDAAELTETVNGETVVVSSEYDRYAVYTKAEGEADFTLDQTIWRVPGTKLYSGETGEYADSAKLTAVTVEETVTYTTPVSTPVTGAQITLQAAVTDKTGASVSTQVLFTITNTDTGAVTQITAANGRATWTAPNSGLYRIVASSSATTATKASTGECYYRAEDPGNNYRLAVKQNGAQVTNISYNAAPVILELQQRAGDIWSPVTSGVSYKVNNTACDASYTPGAAGSYLFSALVDGSLVASSILAVSKVPITVTPTWEGTDTIPDYDDIKLVVTDAQGRTLTSPSLEGIMKVSCGLYNSSGAIASNAATGSYTVTPDFVNDAAKKAEFLSRYSVTINTATIYYFSRSIAVHFSAGENGEVYARYIDPMGTEFAFSDGSQISMDYRLKFVAEPAEGWFVDDWTVTLDGSPVAQSWYTSNTSRYGNTLELTAAGMQALNTSGKKEISVSASFTNETHQITYSAGDNGSLRVTAGSAPLTSGASVAHNAAVTFTAAPAEGMMVEKWLVNGGEYKWEGADALYRENVLTLENISADHTVQVSFAPAATTEVSVSAVDTNSVSYSGATVTVTDAEGNTLADSALGSVPQSNALTFTAAIDNSASAVVQEWQTSTDGTHWTTVTGSGGRDRITIYQHNSDKLYVRVVIAVTQTYKLSWNVAGLKSGDEAKANLIVSSGNDYLGVSGSSYAANIPVTFTPVLDNSYYVVGWSDNVTPAEDGMSATLTLTDNTAVTLTVAKKPTVSWDTSTGGTVGVTGTVNGTANADVTNGGYVDPNTDLTVTLYPAKGYEVGSSIDAAYTDGTGSSTDNKTYTITGVQDDLTITPVWAAIGSCTVTYAVVDKNGADDGGLDGTLAMSAGRKGMSEYAVSDDDDGAETVWRDASVTFTATPDAGYKIGKWFVNGAEQSAAPTLTITGSAPEDVTVQVQFDPVGEEVTYGFDGAGMTDKATLSAVYQANGSTQQDTFPSGNKPTANGAITFTVSDLESGYEVEGWYVNGAKQEGESDTTYTYSVTANVGADVKVKIVRSSYTVTFSGKNGTVSAAVAGDPISSGDSVVGDTEVVFTALPADTDGYTFSGWTVDGAASEETAESLTLTITKDTVVKASYNLDEVRYTVTYGVIGENGTLSARRLNADNTAVAGSRVVFTAAPAEGYQVKGWYSDAEGTAAIPGTASEQNSYTIGELLSDSNVYVAFEPIPTYVITVDVTGLGAVTATVNGEAAEIADNKLTVSRHDDVVLTAAPDAYHYLTGWTLDGAEQGNSSMTLTLTDVTEAHTVAAGFAASQLVSFQTVCGENGALTAMAGYGEALSAIDASTGINIGKGENVVLTAAPDAGNMVKAWTVNGVEQENLSNSLTIGNLSGATVVTVEFEELKLHSIPVPGADAGYAINIVNKTPSDYGKENQIRDRGAVTFTVTPVTGKYLTKLTVNGTDCLTSTGTDSKENRLTVQDNGDGSYTITVANVKGIALNVESVAFQTVQKPLSKVPDALQSQYGTNVETLQTALRAEVTQVNSKVPAGQTALVDITLQYLTEGDGWQDADPEHFPAGGVTVSIPYSELGDTDSSYTFTVIHMFTTEMNGHTIGDTERITPTKTAEGIQFTVTSLSPFAIGWSKYTAPSGGGGGGGGAMPAETVVIQDSVNGKVAADNTCAEEGDTVTLTVEPDKGYTLETLTVTDQKGNELELKNMGGGKYTFTMPASDITVKATFMEDNSMLNFFVDVPADAYYYDAVLWAAKEGITSGTDATHFSPNASCTRAQAVTFLWCAAGSPAPQSHTMPFADVKESDYYYEAVLWAVENGITSGTSATTFSPDATCTRAQIVTFLWCSQKSPAADGVNPFTDVAADAYYADAVLWAAENGITGGTSATTFSPDNDCTRAQIVTFLYCCRK